MVWGALKAAKRKSGASKLLNFGRDDRIPDRINLIITEAKKTAEIGAFLYFALLLTHRRDTVKDTI
jgi:hypothetical protein